MNHRDVIIAISRLILPPSTSSKKKSFFSCSSSYIFAVFSLFRAPGRLHIRGEDSNLFLRSQTVFSSQATRWSSPTFDVLFGVAASALRPWCSDNLFRSDSKHRITSYRSTVASSRLPPLLYIAQGRRYSAFVRGSRTGPRRAYRTRAYRTLRTSPHFLWVSFTRSATSFHTPVDSGNGTLLCSIHPKPVTFGSRHSLLYISLRFFFTCARSALCYETPVSTLQNVHVYEMPGSNFHRRRLIESCFPSLVLPALAIVFRRKLRPSKSAPYN